MQGTGNKSNRAVKRVCVVGAGVMGQAISAHMVNAGLQCILLDIPSEGTDRNQVAKEAIKKIIKSKPSLLFSKSFANRIEIGNIDDDLGIIKDCDLVIEAVVEKLEIKQGLFKKMAKHLGTNTVIASNTSGLSIESMLSGMDESFKQQFLVMHFFNPVRYLHLLEIIPAKETLKTHLDRMVAFGEEKLGKGVVIGKDTTNFVANRIGVYGMMETLKVVAEGDYTIEEVDAIFGPTLGRPRSAIFRTADVVGLDTFVHVANNCYENLSHDEKQEIFKIPSFLERMVKAGWLGQKSGQGFYKKEKEEIFALDPKTLSYHKKTKVRFESLGAARGMSSLKDKLRAVAFATDRAGQLFFDLSAKICIYSANRLYEIADSIVDIDNALKWGFGWEMGPFETWDAIGVKESVALMKDKGLRVPVWVLEMLGQGRNSFYQYDPDGVANVYCPKSKGHEKVELSPREWRIDLLKGAAKNVVKDTDAYSLIDAQNGALIVEFHSKMNAIDNEILNGINEAIDRCEEGQFEALVIANDGKNFSVGANLLLLYMAASQGMWKEIDEIVLLFQRTSKRLRYCSVPTVAAPFQLTLGGGCELSLWCDRIHAHAETYIGLVESGVGLLPGGGGNIEMVDRALKGAIDSPTFVVEQMLMRAFQTVAMAKVATSAMEAKEMMFLKDSDGVSLNRRYLLHDAATTAVSMARTGYIQPAKRSFRLPGKNTFATFDMGLRSFLEGDYISQHDYTIAKKIAHVMTGGNTNSYRLISEDDLLDIEREAFLSLCGEQKTMERIAYMLEHNKPLRN